MARRHALIRPGNKAIREAQAWAAAVTTILADDLASLTCKFDCRSPSWRNDCYPRSSGNRRHRALVGDRAAGAPVTHGSEPGRTDLVADRDAGAAGQGGRD